MITKISGKHSGYGVRGYFYNEETGDCLRNLDGRMDEIFRRNQNQPVGFDITEPPFSNTRGGDYFMFWERGNREKFKKNFPNVLRKLEIFPTDKFLQAGMESSS